MTLTSKSRHRLCSTISWAHLQWCTTPSTINILIDVESWSIFWWMVSTWLSDVQSSKKINKSSRNLKIKKWQTTLANIKHVCYSIASIQYSGKFLRWICKWIPKSLNILKTRELFLKSDITSLNRTSKNWTSSDRVEQLQLEENSMQGSWTMKRCQNTQFKMKKSWTSVIISFLDLLECPCCSWSPKITASTVTSASLMNSNRRWEAWDFESPWTTTTLRDRCIRLRIRSQIKYSQMICKPTRRRLWLTKRLIWIVLSG